MITMGNKLTITTLILVLLSVVPGCSILEVKQPDVYQNNLRDMPKKETLSFKDQQQLKATATAAYQKSEQIYYEGTKPKDELAKFVKEATFRIMAWLGPVISEYNLSSVEDFNKFIEETNKSLEEAQKIKHEYKKKQKEWKHKLATKDELVKSAQSKLEGFKASVFSGIWGFIILIIIILIALAVLQSMTGIPLLSMFLGGVRHIFGGARQIVHGIQDFRDNMKEDIKKEKDGKLRKGKEEALKYLDSCLNNREDESTKKLIRELKKKHIAKLRKKEEIEKSNLGST